MKTEIKELVDFMIKNKIDIQFDVPGDLIALTTNSGTSFNETIISPLTGKPDKIFISVKETESNIIKTLETAKQRVEKSIQDRESSEVVKEVSEYYKINSASKLRQKTSTTKK